METKTTILTDRVRFPENPRWHEAELWFSDMFAQRVMRVDLQGNLQIVAELSDIPTGLGWMPDGRLLIVSAQNRRLLSWRQAGGLSEVADLSSFDHYPCNDLVVDVQGRAYISNVGFDFSDPEAKPQTAPILLVSSEGDVRTAADGLAFPNGMVITPDGKTLIVAESYAARLPALSRSPRLLGAGTFYAQRIHG